MIASRNEGSPVSRSRRNRSRSSSSSDAVSAIVTWSPLGRAAGDRLRDPDRDAAFGESDLGAVCDGFEDGGGEGDVVSAEVEPSGGRARFHVEVLLGVFEAQRDR